MNPKVAIIGAGLGGIATAVKLETAGLHDFTVLEQAGGPGGTWWHNTYPGAEVDVPSQLYSYSFMPYVWRESHGSQADLVQYVRETIDHFKIGDRVRYDARVISAIWDQDRRAYAVEIDGTGVEYYDLVVSCVGMLNVPKYPEWPGVDEFDGALFHAARWEHQHKLAGKRVALVGTGSTGAQIAAAIAPEVSHLYVFQREPGWVIPKGERVLTPIEQRLPIDHPFLYRLVRFWRYYHISRPGKTFRVGSKANKKMHDLCLNFIEETIEDPVLRKQVTPDYPWGCKRVIYSSSFYPALNRENVTLVPRAVKEVAKHEIVDVDGVAREVDAIIVATGFRAQDYLSTLDIVGKEGQRLHDVWADEPRAFLGVTVPKFPNFFILYGPNTNGGGSIIGNLELQADVVVRTVKRMVRKGKQVVDTRPGSMQRWVSWVDKRNMVEQSAGFAGCHNYYFSASGKNVTQYPGGQTEYRMVTTVWPRLGLELRAS